jgi:hypothetical protein
MKKILILVLTVFTAVTLSATNYFVNLSLSTTGTGDSWATAFKTLAEAETAANGNAGVDNIFIKGDSWSINYNWQLKAENYYFSCVGTETLPADRPKIDTDGNGIVESWEFQYPTVLITTNNGNGPTLVATALLDGLTIKHTATRTNTAFTTLICPGGATAQNCVVSGCNLTYTAFSSIQNGGCLAKVSGALKNSLFEKNIINIAASADMKFTPIIEANAVTTNEVSVSGCVIRNNSASFDYSATGVNMTNLRGMALNFTTINSTPIAFVNFSNCLVYNNEFSFSGNTTYPVADRAALAGSLSFSNNTTNGKYSNCTFANNKLTNMKSAMNVFTNASIYHFVYNNVFWNNQNTITSTSTTTNVGMSSSSAQNANTVVSNNIQDCATTGNWGTALTYTNNLLDMSTSNTGAKAPMFKLPSTPVGNSTAGSVELADWRLNAGSYLIAKGAPVSTTGIATDKTGNNFATTPNFPAVGAYEYVVDVSTEISGVEAFSSFNVRFNKLQITEAGNLKIYSISGKLVENKNVSEGHTIILSKGIYIVRFTSPNKVSSQKVII